MDWIYPGKVRNKLSCHSPEDLFISDQANHLVEKGLGSGVGLVVVHERVEVEFARHLLCSFTSEA